MQGARCRGSCGHILGGLLRVARLNRQRVTQDPSMTGPTAILFTLLAGLSLLVFLYPRRRDRSLKDLRGPQSSSFWLGNVQPILLHADIRLMRWFPGNEGDIRYQNEVGDCEFKWMREYGTAWRRAGCFGVSARHSVIVRQLNGPTGRSLDVGRPKSY